MPTKLARVSKITGILLLLFAISILISQSLMDLFSTALCFYLGYQWLRARKAGISLEVAPKMGFDWLWLVWFGVACMGFILNAPPPDTPPHFWLARLVEFKWIFILYFMVGAFRISSFKERGFHWFVGGALACSLYSLIAYYLEIQTYPNEFRRLGGIYQFSMTHAHVYGVVFCFLLGVTYEIYQTLSKPKFLFYLATLLAMGASVLFTYTRGVWISLIVASIAISFLWRLRSGFIAIIVCAILAGGLYTFVPGIKNRVDFTAQMADTEAAKKSYDSERVILWKTNLMIFKDHPFFGTGYGQNKFHLHAYYEKQGLPKDQFTGHAHNQYLHLLAGTGALGLISYLSILAIIAWFTLNAFLKIPRKNLLPRGLALGALGGQICFVFGSLTESNFEHSKVRFAVMFMWAIGIWLWLEYKDAR